MKKLIVAIISISLAASCSILRGGRIETAKPEKKTEENNKPATVEVKKPTIGDTVVARWSQSSWAEGKVESIKGSQANVLWLDETSPSEVELTDVFVMPSSGAQINVKAGDFALVKGSSGNWWLPAEIRETSDGVVKAKIISGGEIVNLPPEKVLGVTPAVAADIKDEAESANFLQKAYQHRPFTSEDYKPKTGDRVVGEWTTNSWYAGRVKSVSNSGALIVWEDGSTPSQTPFDKIVPFPNAADDARTPAAGDFLLLKPNGTSAWIYGQVTSVNGTTVEAKTVDSTREYKAGEFIVLQ